MLGQPSPFCICGAPCALETQFEVLGIKRQDATKGNKLNVLAATCGHSWMLSDGTAIAIRKGLAADRRIISAFLDAI